MVSAVTEKGYPVKVAFTLFRLNNEPISKRIAYLADGVYSCVELAVLYLVEELE